MLIFLFALVLGLSLMGVAQSTDTQSGGNQAEAHHGGDHDRMMDPQAMLNHLDQELSLSADQKTKIQTILENSDKHAQELRSNNSGDHKANHTAMRQLHENTHAQIRATLTPEQQTKFDAMMKDHEKMGKHHDKDATTTTTNENPK